MICRSDVMLISDFSRPFQGRLPNRGSGLKSTDLIDYDELTAPAL
jgi:hypothetical protein